MLTGLPNCSYPTPPANDLFVALSPSEYDGAAACGGFMSVTGPDGSVTVQVIDQCPDCAAGHIDLSEPAFAELAPLGAGLINVHYQYLTDPPLPGPVTMEVKSGSSQYWLALLADNTGNPLASVQVQTASGGWVSLARASYNYWIAQSGAGTGPFTVRLRDTEGNQVTVHNVALDPGAVQSTGVYMYGAGSAPATPAAASASAAASLTARATAASRAHRPARPRRRRPARPSGPRRRPRPSRRRRRRRRSRPPPADRPHRGPHGVPRLTLHFLLLLETYFRTILCAPRFLLLSLERAPDEMIMEDLHAYSVLFFRQEKGFQDLRYAGPAVHEWRQVVAAGDAVTEERAEARAGRSAETWRVGEAAGDVGGVEAEMVGRRVGHGPFEGSALDLLAWG